MYKGSWPNFQPKGVSGFVQLTINTIALNSALRTVNTLRSIAA
jgi:hypothetical protein